MTGATFDVGPNIVATIVALIGFATTVFNGVYAVKTRQTTKAILQDTKPNGGNSGRDTLDKIAAGLEKIAASVESTHQAVTKLPPPPPPK